MIITASDFFSRSAEALLQAEEDAFFSAIRNGNNTFKRTHRARFADLDEELIRAAKEGRRSPREVLDVGISSGTTTLDLQAALTAAGLRPRITGTDLALHASLVPLGGGASALVGPEGHLLQLEVAGRSVRPWRRRLDWLTGMWVGRPLLVRWAMARLGHASERRPVMLVSPRLREDRSIEVVEDNILCRRKEFTGRFDMIRAANILNRDYFGSDQLRAALDNLRSYLSGPGALLLIVRSHNDGSNHGTLFQLREGGRLDVRQRFGDGSEVEELAMQG